MTTRRYIELRIFEALEYIKYSNEDSWSFVVQVGDKKICLAGEKIDENDIDKKNEVVNKFTEALNSMEFSIDEHHIIELIHNLKKVRLFKFVNECINEIANFQVTTSKEKNTTMNRFTIQSNEYLKQNIQAYFHSNYNSGAGQWQVKGSIENIICTLKNDITPYTEAILQNVSGQLEVILRTDLPQILKLSGKNNLVVCVVPRAKVNYNSNQLYFKKTVSKVANQLQGFIDGTDYIKRVKDTKTTHRARSGHGGNGDMPYPNITVNTCDFSINVKDKDILLIDDLYTNSVNIDEDAIQALFDKGAKSVIFYSIGAKLGV